MGTPTLLCVSLVLWGLLGKCAGIPMMPKDKRGWTLNSAGYLLGPHAHRPLMDKGGLAGKREAMEKPMQLGAEPDGALLHPSDMSSLQTLLNFLSSLHLPMLGAVDRLPLPDAAFQA